MDDNIGGGPLAMMRNAVVTSQTVGVRQEMADGIIKVVAKLGAIATSEADKLQAWATLDEAVRLKVADQRWFVEEWWDKRVPPGARAKLSASDGTISLLQQAETESGISNQTVSRWRAGLRVEDAYRASIVQAARVAAGLAPSKADIKRAAQERRKAEIERLALDMPPVDERYRLVEGSVTALMDEPPESLDYIITDPPYPEAFLPLFGDLARGAAHALRPGGLLLCMSGQTHLPAVLAELQRSTLDYLWTLAYLTPGGQAVQVFPRKVNTFWKPILVFSQGEYTGDWYGDVVRSDVNDNDKEHHHWGQSVSGMRDLMQRFVRPADIVCDPFLGGGTTAVVALELGADFLGFDVDPAALLATRARFADMETDDGAA